MRLNYRGIALIADILRSPRISFIFSRDFFAVSAPLYSGNTLRRNPVRVLDKHGKPIPSTLTRISDKNRIPSTQEESLIPMFLKKRLEHRMEENVIKYKKIVDFEDKFSQILTIVKCKEDREKHGKIMLEGVRLINDALEAGAKPDLILFSKPEILSKLRIKDPENIKLFKVFYKTLQIWSGLKTCPGILGVFNKPPGDELHARFEPILPITVICNNIMDPGKLGSIIRSSAAIGCKAVVIMKDCIDAWMHKVLRCGSGAQFRIPIASDIDWTHILNYIPRNSSVFLINSTTNTVNTRNTDYFSYMDKDEDEESPQRYYTEMEEEGKFIVDENYNDWYELQKYANVPLPSMSYTNVAFPKNDIVLIISDETLPIDLKAIKLGCEFGAKQLTIPFENKVQRLSSSLTLSIVLYEIRRQITEEYVL